MGSLRLWRGVRPPRRIVARHRSGMATVARCVAWGRAVRGHSLGWLQSRIRLRPVRTRAIRFCPIRLPPIRPCRTWRTLRLRRGWNWGCHTLRHRGARAVNQSKVGTGRRTIPTPVQLNPRTVTSRISIRIPA